jgi:UDP-N-acetylmuramyl pentapeptide phosphotransferase/UDP-N-acetylglucosamine-1-phosphate transferase
MTWTIIFVLLLALELAYFKIAAKFNIIDKPSERSSHSSAALTGGGIIFALSVVVWIGLKAVNDNLYDVLGYSPFICGLLLVAAISFADDVRPLPNSLRLISQFVAMCLLFFNIGILETESWWYIIIALIVCVGATNIINFMDGINGITAGYGLAVLVPIYVLNRWMAAPFIFNSFLEVVMLGALVFCIFNFRQKGRARCFAGDVGSIGLAFILLFALGRLIVKTGDVTWLIFLLVYGIDGCLTICHRIMLHENLCVAHRKHAYQIMANELGIGHVQVSLIYMALQLVISFGFICLCPNTLLAHSIYLIVAATLLGAAYVLFMKKYYHLHAEYLASLDI